jgi:hypothetical protein
MFGAERKLPPLKDPETGIVTIFPKVGTRRPEASRQLSQTQSQRDRSEARDEKVGAKGDAIRSVGAAAIVRPKSGAAPPPPVSQAISDDEAARKAAAAPDPALSSFFPKLVVPIDAQSDQIEQDVAQFDSLRDIKPGYGTGVQLAAVGPEDAWLTIKPETTFFRKVYRKHSNFAITNEEQYFQNGFVFGKTNAVVLPLAGEAVVDAWLEIELPALSATGTWVEDVGFAIVKEWRFIVGDALIESVPREWSKYASIGRVASEKMDALATMTGSSALDVSVAHTLYIPLPFFFCADGLSPTGQRTVLPIAALSNATSKTGGVRFEAVAEDLANLVNLTSSPTAALPSSISAATVLLDYTMMDLAERAAFLAFGHRILYRQIIVSEAPAYDSMTDGTASAKVATTVGLDGVNRDCANLLVLATDENAASKQTLFKFRTIGSIDLYLNGQQKRFATRPGDYFALAVPYDKINGVPAYGSNAYVYSFVAQGTGSTDNGGHVDLSAFSRPIVRATNIGNNSSSSPAVVKVLAECYNFMTIRDGFAKTDRV